MKPLLAVIMMLLAALGARAQDSAVLELVDQADKAITEQRFADAEKSLVEAIRTAPGDPSNALVMSNLGMVRLYMGQDSAAVATLDRAVALAPAAVAIRSNRARALLATGREAEGVEELERIMEMDTTLAQPYFLRGMLRLHHGLVEQAEADFDRMGRIDPDDPDLDVALATLDDAIGKWEQAVIHYNRAILRDPDPAYYAGRARCQLMLSRFTEAGADIEEALKMTPDDAELFLLRALLSKAQYRPDDAEADGRRAIDLGADPRRVRKLLGH